MNRILEFFTTALLVIPTQAATIPFTIEEQAPVTSELFLGHGRILIEASYDNVNLKCLLDTGARQSIINQRFLPHHSIAGTVEGGGIIGISVIYDLVNIAKVAINDFVAVNKVVRLSKSLQDDCIAGNELFYNESMHFDFTTMELRTDILPTASTENLKTYNDTWYGFPVKIEKQIFDSFWDTGAGLTLLDPKIIEAHPENFLKISDTVINDPTGTSVPAAIYRMKSLRLGNMEVKNATVIAYSTEVLRRTVADLYMVLGYNIIRQYNWHMDVKNKKWQVINRPN